MMTAEPRHRRSPSVLAFLFAVLVLVGACSTELQVDNLPGYVDSVGPVTFDGEALTVLFTTIDAEGDRLDVVAEFSVDGGSYAPVPLESGALNGLITARGESTPHAFTWELGELSTESEIALRLHVSGRPQALITYGPFTPAGLAAAASGPESEAPPSDGEEGDGP